MGLVVWVTGMSLVWPWVLDWFDLGGYNHGSAVVGFLFMDLVLWWWAL